MTKPKTLDGVTYRNTHSGQKRAYGDSYYEYQITSDKPADEVERICSENIHPAMSLAQYQDEYRANPSAENHFRRHYTFKKKPDGSYFYSVCSPYTD